MTQPFSSLLPMAFIGGGNMAQALISGWSKQGVPAAHIHVVEPLVDTRQRLERSMGIHCHESADSLPHDIRLVVWAIKPQVFKDVACGLKDRLTHALHVSVAAGVRSDSMARWLNSARVVRAMPNTPATHPVSQLFIAHPHRVGVAAPVCAALRLHGPEAANARPSMRRHQNTAPRPIAPALA